jgi:phage terminase small subunit
MAKSGDENPQTAELIPFGSRDRRLHPPDSLSDSARAAFIDLVGAMPVSHFRPADMALVCAYSEAVVLAERAAFELSQPNGIVTADNKVSPWFSVHQQATKTLIGLALRLRLGPQSRALKQSKKEPAPVSYYDRMRMEKDWDK